MQTFEDPPTYYDIVSKKPSAPPQTRTRIALTTTGEEVEVPYNNKPKKRNTYTPPSSHPSGKNPPYFDVCVMFCLFLICACVCGSIFGVIYLIIDIPKNFNGMCYPDTEYEPIKNEDSLTIEFVAHFSKDCDDDFSELEKSEIFTYEIDSEIWFNNAFNIISENFNTTTAFPCRKTTTKKIKINTKYRCE